jgi:hypothetical protein
MHDLLWNNEDPITKLTDEITIPSWIDQDISPSRVAAICQGGCSSGAYMPAVTYSDALETMHLHGDSADGVLNYLEDTLGGLPKPPNDISWSGLACHYLSRAVECWASSVTLPLQDELMAQDEGKDE